MEGEINHKPVDSAKSDKQVTTIEEYLILVGTGKPAKPGQTF